MSCLALLDDGSVKELLNARKNLVNQVLLLEGSKDIAVFNNAIELIEEELTYRSLTSV